MMNFDSVDLVVEQPDCFNITHDDGKETEVPKAKLSSAEMSEFRQIALAHVAAAKAAQNVIAKPDGLRHAAVGGAEPSNKVIPDEFEADRKQRYDPVGPPIPPALVGPPNPPALVGPPVPSNWVRPSDEFATDRKEVNDLRWDDTLEGIKRDEAAGRLASDYIPRTGESQAEIEKEKAQLLKQQQRYDPGQPVLRQDVVGPPIPPAPVGRTDEDRRHIAAHETRQIAQADADRRSALTPGIETQVTPTGRPLIDLNNDPKMAAPDHDPRMIVDSAWNLPTPEEAAARVGARPTVAYIPQGGAIPLSVPVPGPTMGQTQGGAVTPSPLPAGSHVTAFLTPENSNYPDTPFEFSKTPDIAPVINDPNHAPPIPTGVAIKDNGQLGSSSLPAGFDFRALWAAHHPKGDPYPADDTLFRQNTEGQYDTVRAGLPGAALQSAPSFDRTPFDRYQTDYGKAATDNARLAQELAAKRDTILENDQIRQDRINSDREDRMKKHDEDQASIITWLSNPANDIDPNRLWHNAGTGGKIAAAFGLILSGAGGAASHTPNLAAQIIDKATDQDVEAQKSNRAGKSGLLSFYLNQGREINDAAKMAKADLLDRTNGLLTRNLNQFAGPQAVNDARMVIAKNAQDAYRLRQEAELNDLHIRALPGQIADEHAMRRIQQDEGDLRLRQQNAEMDYMLNIRSLMTGGQTPSGGKVTASVPDQIIWNTVTRDPQQFSKHFIKLPVVVPVAPTDENPAGYATARDHRGEAKVEDAITRIESDSETGKRVQDWLHADRVLGKLGSWIQKHPSGTLIPSDKAELKAILDPLAVEMAKSAGAGKSLTEIGKFTDLFGSPESLENAFFDNAKKAYKQVVDTHYGEYQDLTGTKILRNPYAR